MKDIVLDCWIQDKLGFELFRIKQSEQFSLESSSKSIKEEKKKQRLFKSEDDVDDFFPCCIEHKLDLELAFC